MLFIQQEAQAFGNLPFSPDVISSMISSTTPYN